MATIDELLQQAATVDGYATAGSLGTDKGMYSANEAEFDLRTMTPNMLRQKYGAMGATQMMDSLQQGISNRQGDMNIRDNRTLGQTAFDSATGVGAGFVGGVGGLLSLGAGLAHEDAGTWLGEKVQEGMAWTEEQQSASVNAARRLQRAESGVDARDNTALMEQEEAEGTSNLVAGLRRWGRDTVDTLGNSITDPTMLTQGTSEAVGSLLAGGPISKSLKAIGAPIAARMRAAGPLTRGADRAIRAGDYAAWPAAIAGLEAGGAYSGTVSEIMGMEHDQLMETSPEYRGLIESNVDPVEARTQLANRAGLMAAAIQAPIAGVTGLLTRYAETPFKVPSFGSAARNTLLNEPLEEAVQSTTGGLASGYAVQQYADENRQLSEGLGEQTAQGALYGLTAAGTVQAPGAAAQAPLAAGRLAYNALKRTGSALNNVVSKHYNQQAEEIDKASPISEEVIQSSVEQARPQVMEMVPALQGIIDASTAEPEQKARESAFVQSLSQAWDLTPEEVAGMPPEVRDAPNRFVAVHQMSRRIAALPEGSRDQLAAIAAREALLEPINNLQSPDLQILSELEDGQTKNQLNFVRSVLANSVVTPADRRADAVIDSLTEEGKTPVTVEELSDTAIETPEGQQSAQAAAALMAARPGSGTLEVANLLMKHARSGKLNLTPSQLRAVEASYALLQAADLLAKGKANGDLKPADIVNGQVLNDRRDPLSKDPRFKQSARQHISNVLSAMRSGNIPEASALMQDFGLFVQHMQNKLDAHNRHYGIGDPSAKKIGFKALDPDATNRVWYDSAPSVFVNTKSEDSVRHAQTVALEANTLADLFNNLVDALPELNLSNQKVEKVSLDPALEGTPKEVVQRHAQAPVQPQQQETQREQEVTPTPEASGTTEVQAERVETGTETQSEESGSRSELIQQLQNYQGKVVTDVAENALNNFITGVLDDGTFIAFSKYALQKALDLAKKISTGWASYPKDGGFSAQMSWMQTTGRDVPQPSELRDLLQAAYQVSEVLNNTTKFAKPYKTAEEAANKVFSDGVWEDWTIGRTVSPDDIVTMEDLCLITSKDIEWKLLQAGYKAARAFSGVPVPGHPESEMDHYVAIAEIAGELFVVDQPQSELFVVTDPTNNNVRIKQRKFTPRFIPFSQVEQVYGKGVNFHTVSNVEIRSLDWDLIENDTSGSVPEQRAQKILDNQIDNLEEKIQLEESQSQTEATPVSQITEKQVQALSDEGTPVASTEPPVSETQESEGPTRKIKNGTLTFNETTVGPVQVMEAVLDGEVVGTLNYSLDDSLDPEVNVEESFRRRGVASAMYDLARERRGDREIPRASRQSDEGRDFRDAQLAPTTASMYPDLLNTGDHSLHTALLPNTENPSRIASQEDPVAFVADALQNQDALEAVVGETNNQLTEEISQAYRRLLSTNSSKTLRNLGGLLEVMQTNLEKFLNTKNYRALMEQGVAHRWQRGKALNILNQEQEYNPTLVQAAALAGLQWMLSFRQSQNVSDDATYVAITGIPDAANIHEDIKNLIDNSVSTDQVKTAIAKKVMEYWGLRSNPNMDNAYAEGIAEGVAAEVMTALFEAGFMDSSIIELSDQDGLPEGEFKTINRYSIARDAYPEVLQAFPTAIDEVVLTNPEPARFLDGQMPPVANTQMNTPSVENTADQKKAIKAANEIPYMVNMPVLRAYEALGEDGLITLFSGRKSHWTSINERHQKAQEGRELSITNAFKEINATVSELVNRAAKAGSNIVDSVIRYAHNMSKVGRLQQLGAYNPQANKTTREVFLPTWSTLDLVNNNDHINAFFLAMAQHLDEVKTAKISMQASVNAARESLDTTFAPLVQYLRDWSKEEGAKLDATKIQELLNGRDISQAAFHSLIEYARFLEATPEERSNFRTAMYLEADGVTNGPIMAMMMMTLGKFTPNWLHNVAKGGITFGTKKTMAEAGEAAKVDLYKTATIHMEAARKVLLDKINQQKNRRYVNENMTALSVVMDSLFGKDVSYDPTTGTLTFERGIAKNPLTITLYGSSAMGIAGNFANQVLDALAVWDTEVQSQIKNDDTLTEADVMFDGDQDKWNMFNNALNHLRDNVLAYSAENDQLNVFQSNYENDSTGYKALRDNFLYGFVEPMVTGIEQTVGPQLVKAMTQMRKATQVQSIFLEYAFREEVQKVLAEKKEQDPTRARMDFLSKKDFAAIDKRMEERFPNIKTKTQEFRVAKSQRNFDENVDYSRGLDESHRTMANVYAPADAGVSGIASLVIGFGDGYMIQVAVQNPLMDRTLNVFDGINMPLDNLAATGEVANKSAHAAFMQNPLLPVWQAYSTFRSEANMEDVPEAMLKQLAHAFQNPKEPRLTPEELAPLLPSLMEELENNLAWSAKSIEARHRALQEVPMSVDHMASASAAYVNDVQAYEMSENDLLAFLNERYQHYMDTLEFKTTFTATRVTEEVPEATGVVIHTADNLASLVQEMNLTQDQKTIVDQIMSSLKAADYTIVSGSMKDITDYRIARNLPVHELSGEDLGFMSIGEKKIYMINPSAETLTHELVHAATLEVLQQYYKGVLKDPSVKKAVENIESMMNDFIAMEVDQTLPSEVATAIEDAQTTILTYLAWEGDDQVYAMTGAVNEFMAWSLSNQQLMDRLKEQKVPRAQKWTKKDLRLIKWAKDVIESIKSMLWSGKKYARATNNALANLQFNTAILINTQPSLVEAFEEVTLYHTTGMRPLLDDVRTTLRDKILAVANRVDPVDRQAYEATHKKYLIETEELSKLLSRAFRLSTIEESTLVSVAAAMGTEMQLDPNVLQRMQTMWTHVQKNLKVEDLKDPNAVDQQSDDHWAIEKFNLLMGKTNRLVDPSDRTTLLPVFVGMSLVSQEMRDLLAKIEPPRSMKSDGTFDNGVRQFARNLMNSLSARMTGERNSLSVREAMDSLMDRLYHNILNEQSNLDAIETMIDKPSLSTNDKMVGMLSAASDKGFEYGKKLQAPTNNAVTKAVGRVLQLTAGLASEKNGDAVAEGALSTAERLDLNNGLFSLLKDFIGRTDATKEVYDLIKPIRAMVQQIRQQFRESVPQVISEAFKTAPTKEQYATMFRSMAKTDLPSLVSSMSKADVLRLFTDPSFLDQQILDLENRLRTMDGRNFRVLQDKMKQLSHFMNTGVRGNNLLRNAHAVSRLWNERTTSNRQAVSTEMQDAVDQLISLYSVEGLSKADHAVMASLVRSERDGLNFVLSYLEGQRRTEIRKARQGKALQNHYKGYIYSLPQKTGHMVVADDTEYTSMIEKGYSRVKDYTGSDILNIGVRRGYYYTDLPARSAFAQGMIQNVDQTAYGVDPVTGFSRDLVAGRIVSRRLVQQLEAQMKNEKSLTENLSPIYNDSGRVIAFEQTMNIRELDRLEPSNQLHEMLGVWRGRQVEERISQQMNKVLFDQLHDHWQRDKNHTPELYVNLLDSKNLDAVQRDAVSLFSDESKAYIEQKFGKGVFMVRKSLLDDVTGYRQPSVSDFWTNINRASEGTNEAIRKALISMLGPKAYRYLVQAEQIIQGLVTDARTTIVVRSVLIPAINIVSNIYQLIQRGVNPIQIARDTPGIINQLNGYIESRLEQIRLEAQLRAATDDIQQTARLRAKIRSITDSHKRLAIWPLIEAGEFSTIADVGMSRDDLELSSGRIHEWIEKQVNKLPPGLQTAAKYGMVSRDTALFQGLQKSVQFGDFVAKAILYDHLTKKKRMPQKEALGIITEEYVNYDRLPGRVRGGLENIGVLWFFNFKLRSVKVALSTLRNNPLHAMFGMLLPTPSGIGTPIDENAIAKGLEGNLGYSIGPGMGMRAPFLNPWYQLVD